MTLFYSKICIRNTSCKMNAKLSFNWQYNRRKSIIKERNIQIMMKLQTESGRIWFSRVVNARRARACVTEASFYSLAQHFAVALFECHEADDFAPAKSLMNMCFTFYHEGKSLDRIFCDIRETVEYTWIMQQMLYDCSL